MAVIFRTLPVAGLLDEVEVETLIRLVLDSIAAGYEQDIRELVQAFYPGEEFEIRTPEGVHFSRFR